MLFCHLAWRFVYASSSFPSIFLSFPLRLDRERGLHSPLPLQLLECLFSFSFLQWRKIEEEGGEKVSGEACRFFFIFFDSSFDEWRIRLFGIGWGVVL